MAGKGDLLAELERAITVGDQPKVRRLAERLRYRSGWVPGERLRSALMDAGVDPWWLDQADREVAV